MTKKQGVIVSENIWVIVKRSHSWAFMYWSWRHFYHLMVSKYNFPHSKRKLIFRHKSQRSESYVDTLNLMLIPWTYVMLIPWINLMLLPWTSKLYYKSESLLDLREAAASGQCIHPSIQSSFCRRLWLWFWWKLWWSCTTWCRWKLVIFHFSFSLLQPTLPSLQSGPTTGEGESDVMGFFQKHTWICLERQD